MPKCIKDLVKSWPPRSWSTNSRGDLWTSEEAVIESVRLGKEKFFLDVSHDGDSYKTTIFLKDLENQDDFKKVYDKLSESAGLTLAEASQLEV